MSYQTETEDYNVFGADAFVYCNQHLRPHRTGWCTVSANQKVLLNATTDVEAYKECEAKGLYIFDSTPFSSPQKPFYPNTNRK